MTTRLDDGPEFEPDDPLAVILRPADPLHLGPPPGRFEAIRRSAARRRLLRVAAGVGLSCVVAAIVTLPIHLAKPEAPRSPTVPMAPPPASGRTSAPATPPVSPTPSLPDPSVSDAPSPSVVDETSVPTELVTPRPTSTTPGTEEPRPPSSEVPTSGQSAAPTPIQEEGSTSAPTDELAATEGGTRP
ncbi:hypothetical protein [Streptomyces cavernae]|uniref:hypothetical protein n=1 Tax=Streptomyces cavernae TaxID=2259034 RepID=UPI0012D8F65C|nr:hypothetical protein [Streptomyces cavernae]